MSDGVNNDFIKFHYIFDIFKSHLERKHLVVMVKGLKTERIYGNVPLWKHFQVV